MGHGGILNNLIPRGPGAVGEAHGITVNVRSVRLYWSRASAGTGTSAGYRGAVRPGITGNVAGDVLVRAMAQKNPEVAMRWFWTVVAVWLLIGVLAAAQRNYYNSSSASCSGVGTIW